MTVTDLTFEQSKNNPCITRGIHTCECDLIQFRKKFGEANITSLVERVSRFTVFLRNIDRGTEFTDWPHLQAGLGTQIWLSNRVLQVKSV